MEEETKEDAPDSMMHRKGKGVFLVKLLRERANQGIILRAGRALVNIEMIQNKAEVIYFTHE